MGHSRFSASLLFIWAFAISGCGDTDRLESQIAEGSKVTETRFSQLNTDLDSLKSNVDVASLKCSDDLQVMKSELQQIRDQWNAFQRSYSPETQRQLEENLKIAETNSSSVEKIKTMADELLKTIQQLESESLSFRNAAAEHAAESKEFDKMSEFELKFDQLSSEVKSIQSAANSAVRDARSALSKAKSAESKARQAESMARRKR